STCRLYCRWKCAKVQLSDLGASARFNFTLAHRQAAVPGVTDDQPSAQAAPRSHEPSLVAEHRIPQIDRNRVTADLNGHIGGIVHPSGLEAQVLVSQLAQFAQRALDPLRSLA